MVDSAALEFGVVGLVLIILYRVLEVGKTILLAKKINGNDNVHVAARQSTLACQVDPTHYNRIKIIDGNIRSIMEYTDKNKEIMGEVRKAVAAEKFQCLWKDRDEIRDFLEGYHGLTKAMIDLTDEVKRLKPLAS